MQINNNPKKKIIVSTKHTIFTVLYIGGYKKNTSRATVPQTLQNLQENPSSRLLTLMPKRNHKTRLGRHSKRKSCNRNCSLVQSLWSFQSFFHWTFFFFIIIPDGVLMNLSVLLPFSFGQISVVYVVDLLLTGPELMSAETRHPIR